MDLKGWSREQGHHPRYGVERGFYNLSQGGSADRALLIMVRHIARQGEQARAITDQVMEVGTTTKVTAVLLRHLDEHQDQTRDHAEALQKEAIATRVELRELRGRQAIMERRSIEVDQRVKEI